MFKKRLASTLLFLALALPSTGWAQVELLQTASVAGLNDPLRQYIEESQIHLLDPAQFPEVFRHAAQLEAMIERIHAVQPISEMVRILILDSSSPEAYVKQLSNGETVISISAGLLHFAQNDHELAYVLSHEMEHPNSRLEHNMGEIERERQWDEKEKEWARRFVARSAETEADLRGIYYRMMEAGYNPYAAEDFVDRLLGLYGDSISNSHTSTHSRRDAISLAITGMRRAQGRQIAPSDHYDDHVTRPIQEFLLSERFLDRQRRRIQDILDHLDLDIDSIFEQVRSGGDQRFERLPYLDVYEPLREDILRMAYYYLPDAEIHGFLTQLHAHIDDAFMKAHQRFLSSRPTWRSAMQVTDYFMTLQRRFDTVLPNLPEVLARIIELQDKISSVRGGLASAASGSTDEARLQSELRLLEKKLRAAHERRSSAELAYEPIPEDVIETFRQNFRTQGHPARRVLEAALYPYLKGLSHRMTRSISDTTTYASPEVLSVLARALAFERYSLFDGFLPPGIVKRVRSEAWFMFVQAFSSQIANASERELVEINRRFGNLTSPVFPIDTLEAAVELDPTRIAERTTQLIDQILDSRLSPLTRMHFLNELVYTNNGRFRPSDQQALRVRYLATYNELLGQTFLDRSIPGDIERRSLTALRSYQNSMIQAARLAESPATVHIASAPFVRATQRHQEIAAEHGAPVPRSMILFQDRSIFDILALDARPKTEEMWQDFLSLPSDAPRGAQRLFRTVSFSSVVELFENHVSQSVLLDELYERRALLKFERSSSSAQAHRELFRLVRERDPADMALAAQIIHAHSELGDLRAEFFSARVRTLMANQSGSNLRQATTQIVMTLDQELTRTWTEVEVIRVIQETHSQWLPTSVSDRIEVVLGIRDATRTNLSHYPLEQLGPNHFLNHETQRNEASLPLLIEYWKSYARNPYTRSRSTDEIFENIWRRAQADPAMLSSFDDPRLVGYLHFDDVRMTLAEWQLKRLLNSQSSTPSRTGIRPEVTRAMELVNAQIDEANLLKNQLIALIENTLVTNEEETQRLSQYRQSLSNPRPSRGVLLVDAVHHAVKLARSNHQKLEMISYLTGRAAEPPSFLNPELAITMQRHYLNAGTASRGYALQALLDSQEGILSEPATTESFYALLLGDQLSVPLIRALFEAYLETLPPSEKTVLLSQITAHLNPRDTRGLGLKTVLEFMGPLGIKVGQFLRTSGLVSRELAAELNGFLDHALPPDRPQIFGRLREVFGERTQNIEVGTLIGSGSINYVVLARFDLPGMSDKWVAIRLTRPEAVGQIQNENQLWIGAVQKLRESGAPDSNRTADVIEESRLHAMTTLSPEGAEFNQELERSNYANASRAYRSRRSSRTGLHVTAMEPNLSLQSLVPEPYSRSVTVMEYIRHTPLSSLPSGQRQLVVEQILRAEFEALFERGTFDPDGHPGNWLNHLASDRLVRIDYAQLRSATPQQRLNLKALLRILVQTDFSSSDITQLSEQLSTIFDGEVNYTQHRHLVAQLLRSAELPSNQLPHERILYLRERIETALNEQGASVAVRLNSFARAALSSLGRTLGFQDQMTAPDRYQELLLEALGTSRLRVGARSLWGWTQTRISRRASYCESFMVPEE